VPFAAPLILSLASAEGLRRVVLARARTLRRGFSACNAYYSKDQFLSQCMASFQASSARQCFVYTSISQKSSFTTLMYRIGNGPELTNRPWELQVTQSKLKLAF
jgi:hypothetical protein